jgi:hypothetical protein
MTLITLIIRSRKTMTTTTTTIMMTTTTAIKTKAIKTTI